VVVDVGGPLEKRPKASDIAPSWCARDARGAPGSDIMKKKEMTRIFENNLLSPKLIKFRIT